MSVEETTATTAVTNLPIDMAGLHSGAPKRLVFNGNKADFWKLFLNDNPITHYWPDWTVNVEKYKLACL